MRSGNLKFVLVAIVGMLLALSPQARGGEGRIPGEVATGPAGEVCETTNASGIAVDAVLNVSIVTVNSVSTATVTLNLPFGGITHIFTATGITLDFGLSRMTNACTIFYAVTDVTTDGVIRNSTKLATEIVNALGFPGRTVNLTQQSTFGLPCPLNPAHPSLNCPTPAPSSLPDAFPKGVSLVFTGIEITGALGQITLYLAR